MDAMKIQINNDFQLALSVLANGTAEPLTYATDIEVAVQNLDAPRVRCTLAPVVVNGNVVTVAVDSTVLNTTGRYLAAITYVINGARRYAENGDAFTLVRSAAEADIEGESAAADLRVKFEASGKDGLSAYELAKQAGYAGTFEEWLAAGENANNAALLAKEGAALAVEAANNVSGLIELLSARLFILEDRVAVLEGYHSGVAAKVSSNVLTFTKGADVKTNNLSLTGNNIDITHNNLNIK